MLFLQALRPATTVMMAAVFYLMLAELRVSRKMMWRVVVGFALLSGIGVGLVMHFAGADAFRQYYVLLLTLPALVTSISFSKRSPSKVFFTMLMVWYLCCLVFLPSTLVVVFWGENVPLDLAIRAVVFTGAVLLMRRYIVPMYRHILSRLDIRWWLFCPLPMALLFIIQRNIIDPFAPDMGKFAVGVSCIGMLTLVYVTYYVMFRKMEELYEREHLAQAMQLQLKLQAERFSLMESKVEASRRFDHDLRHYLRAIACFIEDGHPESALDYIGKLRHNLDDQQTKAGTSQSYCENYIVDILLSYYIDLAKQAGIAVSTDIRLPAQALVDEVDLGVLLANALQNAVEGCQRSTGGELQLIIHCTQTDQRLMISIRNTCTVPPTFGRDGLPVSSRADGGIGTRSIASTVQKFGGTCAFSARDGWFDLSILFACSAIPETTASGA